jgi:uncharacterized NAD(P)/FAD-binding protein YdhS
LVRAVKRFSVTDFYDVAIVGGGYSGTVLAIHLSRQLKRGSAVAIVEPRAELGSGLAYSTDDDIFKINVPAHLMGVSDLPADRFIGWLQASEPNLTDDARRSYVPRRRFGAFVRARLAEAMAGSRVTLRHIQTTATDARRADDGIELSLASAPGFPIRARQLVIATSHGLPAIPHGIPPSVRNAPNFIRDPWQNRSLAGIERDDDVLIIGTGLTMADAAAWLLTQGHSGRIVAFSRHGLLARANGPSAAPGDLDFSTWPAAPVSRYLRMIRAEIARVEAAGGSWRDVFTALRQQSGQLWSKLATWEKRRFIRHLKVFYDAHRYRMAPEIADHIDAARRRGQIEILAARLTSARVQKGGFEVELCCRSSGKIEARTVSAIVNCTGPKQELRPDPSHFVGALVARGLVSPDRLGLGLLVDKDFRIYGLCRSLYALGPLTRERFGDTVGAPEIMAQAERLARILAAELAERCSDASASDRRRATSNLS